MAVSRGYVCFFPDAASLALLKKAFPNVPDDVHLTVLVIDDVAEIQLLAKHQSGFAKLSLKKVNTKRLGLLHNQKGEELDVLFVDETVCSTVKKQICEMFVLTSDVYPEQTQQFHITLGPRKSKSSSLNDFGETLCLSFDKCVFSVMASETQKQVGADKSESKTSIVNNEEANDDDADFIARQSQYLAFVSSHLDQLIPENKRHRWCLLFGQQLFSDFASEQEAKAYQQDNKSLLFTLVAPNASKLKM